MNFLAHLLLSGENRAVQAGNLFGDEIKGKDYTYLPNDIARGVSLHRFIDNHADTSEVNYEVKKHLHQYFSKYAGVALDIYYDHFLSIHWDTYSDVGLEAYTEGVYQEMPAYLKNFSNHSKHLFENMSKYNWLSGYGTMEGMSKTFNGMARILPENSGMKYAMVGLKDQYEIIEIGFHKYFPVLFKESRHKLVDLFD